MSLGCRHFQLKTTCPICSVAGVPAEQQARNLLERMEVPGAQAFSAGEIVELANLIRDRDRYRRGLENVCDLYGMEHPAKRMHEVARKALGEVYTDAELAAADIRSAARHARIKVK
jgi:hypothetical protein